MVNEARAPMWLLLRMIGRAGGGDPDLAAMRSAVDDVRAWVQEQEADVGRNVPHGETIAKLRERFEHHRGNTRARTARGITRSSSFGVSK